MTKQQKKALRKGAKALLAAQPDEDDQRKNVLKKGAKAFLDAHPDEDEKAAKEAFRRDAAAFQDLGLSESAAVHAVLGRAETRGLFS